jgi:hypothetical protein
MAAPATPRWAPGTWCGVLAPPALNIRNIAQHQALLSDMTLQPLTFFAKTQEGTMATKHHDQIVETPTEARQAEPGPSVLALLSVSLGLAVLILGGVWFVFFRT